MNNEEAISFGAVESFNDPRTLSSSSFATGGAALTHGKVPLDYDMVKELCNQRLLGVCTMCGIRMAVEQHFHDGVRLSEYWGYLMGKVIYDNPLFGEFEGSSALTMLKLATNYGIPEAKFCESYKLKVDGTYDEFIEHFKIKYGGKIPQDILDNAKNHKIPGYFRIFSDQILSDTPSASEIAANISAGRIVVARFSLGDNLHKDKKGNYTRLAKDLLPVRAPEVIKSGHIMAINEFWENDITFSYDFGGPNSWGRTWCADNTKQEAGYYWFEYITQRGFFTEAWAIISSSDKYNFTKDLTLGSTGPDVVALQKYLVRYGFMTMPSGVSYGFFGEITRAAVARYQQKFVIYPMAGYFGPKTRAHLNSNQ